MYLSTSGNTIYNGTFQYKANYAALRMTRVTSNFKLEQQVQFILSYKRIGHWWFHVTAQLPKLVLLPPRQHAGLLREELRHIMKQELQEMAATWHLKSTTSLYLASPLLQRYLCDVTRRPFSHWPSINTTSIVSVPAYGVNWLFTSWGTAAYPK